MADKTPKPVFSAEQRKEIEKIVRKVIKERADKKQRDRIAARASMGPYGDL